MSTLGATLVAIFAGAAFSAVALSALLRFRERLPQAAANPRSLHEGAVPRVGGLAIWAGLAPLVLAGIAAVPGGDVTWAATGLVLAVSFHDDRLGVHPAVRLALQFAAAAMACLALLGRPATPGGAAALTVACIAVVWSANAYNFMDGSDGLAATMTLTGFGAYAAGALIAGTSPAAYVGVLAATVPFALVNWPPARMFMGDCGSVPIGFLAAVCGLGEWLRGTWPGWFPLLVFLPFLADASVTLAWRLLRRERVWEAHRSHYYQRWLQLGAGHAGTLARYGAIMAGTALSALLALRIEPGAGWAVLVAWSCVLGLVFVRIDYDWRQHTVPPA